mgnify:CR=1 FL=1
MHHKLPENNKTTYEQQPNEYRIKIEKNNQSKQPKRFQKLMSLFGAPFTYMTDLRGTTQTRSYNHKTQTKYYGDSKKESIEGL